MSEIKVDTTKMICPKVGKHFYCGGCGYNTPHPRSIACGIKTKECPACVPVKAKRAKRKVKNGKHL